MINYDEVGGGEGEGRCDVGNNFIFLVNFGVSGPLDRIAHPVYSRGGQNFTTFDST